MIRDIIITIMTIYISGFIFGIIYKSLEITIFNMI